MEKYKKNYQKMAKLVASKLSKEELVELAQLLDSDIDYDFCFCVQEETEKIAPELFASSEVRVKL